MSIYCIAPWTHGFVHADGTIRPCCVSTAILGDTHRGDTISSVWNSDSYKELRKTMLSGEIPASCSSCPRQERATAVPRKNMIEKQIRDPQQLREIIENDNLIEVEPNEIKTLDLSFGKLCNLRCRFCSPLFSSSWVSNANELLEKDEGFWARFGYRSDAKYNRNPENYVNTMSNLSDFSSIEFIEIKGGEPFLSKEWPVFLEEICRKGFAHKIKIHFTSNLTIVNKDVLNILEKFKRVSCNISIDATGPLYQYLRGEKYTLESDVCANLLKLDQNEKVFININSVISVMNIFNVVELAEWYEQLNLKKLQRWVFRPIAWPEPLALRNLTPELKSLAIENMSFSTNENVQAIVRILEKPLSPASPTDVRNMVKYITEIDEVRGTRFLDYVPEFESIFSEYSSSL